MGLWGNRWRHWNLECIRPANSGGQRPREFEEVALTTGSHRKAECCLFGEGSVAALKKRRPTCRRHKGSLCSEARNIQTSCRWTADIFSSCPLLHRIQELGACWFWFRPSRRSLPCTRRSRSGGFQSWATLKLFSTKRLPMKLFRGRTTHLSWHCSRTKPEFRLGMTMTEEQAQTMHQELVVLTLGVIRIGKPYCVLTARVLFDGTDGSTVNTKTRIGDQELAPVRCRFGSRDQTGFVVSVVSDIIQLYVAPTLRSVGFGLTRSA